MYIYCICNKNNNDLFDLIYSKSKIMLSYMTVGAILRHDNAYMLDKIIAYNGNSCQWMLPQICGRNKKNIMEYIKNLYPDLICMMCSKFAKYHK